MNAAERRLALHEGVGAVWQVVLFVLVLVVLTTRSPDMFTHAQFYAEDGAVWYADAYNLGWLHSLAIPDGGYLNSLQRLCAGAALLVPFALAPLLMNLMGLLIQCVPVTLLLSARTRNWAPLTTRAFIAALYVALPNVHEIHVVLTNSQWHLALIAPLLLFSEPPKGWAGRAVDIILLLTAGFSGPFALILLPLVAVYWWRQRHAWTLVQLGLIGVGAIVQVSVLLTHPSARKLAALGPTVQRLMRMVGGDIFAASMFGPLPWETMPYKLILVAALCGVSLYVYCLLRAPLPFKLLILYALLLLPPALHAPLIAGPKPLWQMLVEDHACRYWTLPIVAFVAGAAWCSQHAGSRFFRWAGVGVVLAMSIGIVVDWRYRRWEDVHFPESVQRFEAARPGKPVVINILPSGWTMTLIKKP